MLVIPGGKHLVNLKVHRNIVYQDGCDGLHN